ncbi:hypothetical protein B0T14DRAFT_495470 [Immersiella caudata]|uniref:Heterokaryon incompatibility domain-containing protein n=1 Tax=Immersiella caudata TaxID=314043 RepID=A0AA39WYS7_9PEZI|nr:hypothetical protein B0T14DRAFT_495470 [Immersiella caudata]
MEHIFKNAAAATLLVGDYIDDPSPPTYKSFDPEIPLGSQFGVESTFTLIQKLAEDHHLFYYESPHRRADPLPPKPLKLRHDYTQGILSLITQPWWSRIWTVQEAVLPKNPATQYGSCHKLTELRKSSPPLEQLLRSFRDRTATDPRDMVYGLLGIVRGEDIPSGIQPDYTIGTDGLYSIVTRKVIQRRGDLCWLGPHRFEDGASLHRKSGLPSWVPDYTTVSEWITILEEVAPSAYWNPCDFRSVHLEPTDSPLVLPAAGICFDEVIAVSDVVAPCPRSTLFATMKKWTEISHSLGLWQTPYPPGDHKGTYEELWWMIAYRGLRMLLDDLDGEHFRPATMEDRDHIEEAIASPDGRLNGVMPHLLWWERFFVTRKGYIGLAGQNARVGDTVHVLVGGRQAAAASQQEPNHTSKDYGFVGDAFVLGIMEGGPLPSDNEGDKLEKHLLVNGIVCLGSAKHRTHRNLPVALNHCPSPDQSFKHPTPFTSHVPDHPSASPGTG